MASTRRSGHRSPQQLVFYGALALYFVAQFAEFIYTSPERNGGTLPQFLDTAVFEMTSRQSWTSLDLWAGRYVFGYPVILKLLGFGFALHVVQSALSIACWMFLAWTVFRALGERWTGVVAGIWLLLISLHDVIQFFNGVPLTDSLSVSLTVLLVAFAIIALSNRSVTVALLALPAVIVWASVRQSNFVLVGLAALGLGIFALVDQRYRQRAGLIAVALLTIVLSFVTIGQRAGQNGQQMYHFLLISVDSNQVAKEFFEDAGMPTGEAETEAGASLYVPNKQTAFDPRLREFRRWTVTKAPSVYLRWLLTTSPLDRWDELAENLPVTLGNSLATEQRDQTGLASLKSGNLLKLPRLGSLARPFYIDGATMLAVWALGVTLGLTAVLRLRGLSVIFRAPLGLVSTFLLVSFVPHAFIAYFGGSVGIKRHMLGASVQLRIGLLLATVWMVDLLLRGLAERSREPSETGMLVAPAVGGDFSSVAPQRWRTARVDRTLRVLPATFVLLLAGLALVTTLDVTRHPNRDLPPLGIELEPVDNMPNGETVVEADFNRSQASGGDWVAQGAELTAAGGKLAISGAGSAKVGLGVQPATPAQSNHWLTTIEAGLTDGATYTVDYDAMTASVSYSAEDNRWHFQHFIDGQLVREESLWVPQDRPDRIRISFENTGNTLTVYFDGSSATAVSQSLAGPPEFISVSNHPIDGEPNATAAAEIYGFSVDFIPQPTA